MNFSFSLKREKLDERKRQSALFAVDRLVRVYGLDSARVSGLGEFQEEVSGLCVSRFAAACGGLRPACIASLRFERDALFFPSLARSLSE